MILEKVIFTALPNGLDQHKRLRLSVHVAPRLTTDDGDPSPRELKEYLTFEAWPERLAGYGWKVEFDNGVTAAATPDEGPRADLWPRLFPAETFVRPHAYTDHAKKTLHSFPVREVLQFIESTYASLSAEGPGLPSIDGQNALTAAFGPLAGLTNVITDSSSFWDEVDRADSQLPDKERPDGTVVRDNVSGSSSAANALFEAYRFYYRPGSHRPDFDQEFGPDYVEPKPKPPEFDFHDLVGLVADHPRLQRMLGLVVDLTLELDDPLGQLGAGGMVRVIPDGELPTDVTVPWTRFDLEDRWFGARPKDAFRMEHGLVRLTPEFWDLFQVDVDGAALQAVGMGDVLARLTDPDQRNHETPSETGAPALRSGGFSLARQRRADDLLESLKDHRDLNDLVESSGNVTFDAEDLVRGYRFDMYDENGAAGKRWYPLHERVTTHTIGTYGAPDAETLEPIRDEGFLKSTSASSEREDHPAPSDDLYLHETVVSWDGWSLAAPRPGKRIVEPGEGEDGGESPLARHDPGAGQLRPLVSVVTVAPKSLPMLRVGHTYRVRMRTVDLAGNSMPFSPKELAPPESDLASEAQLAVRFEPVPSPTVLRRHLDTEGESLEHLVIRSNGGISAKDYGAPLSYAEDSQRHVAPPKGSMQMAEFDGKFDKEMRGAPAAVTGALRTALREEGTFLDPKIVNVSTGKKSVNQTTISTHPAGTAVPSKRGTGLSGGTDEYDDKIAGAYAFYPKNTVELPYLPDPMAIGIAIVGYDVTGAEVLNHTEPFPGKWPELAPFRIRLSELPAPEPPAPPTPPTIKFTGGVLEIGLPKAAVVRAQLSSIFPGGRLQDFAIWDWTDEQDRTPDLEAAALGGRHWMLTPYRWLTLTHAVQQPLLVPDMTKVTVSRKLGQTFASFDGPILNHARSTGRLDVFAHWTEDVDLIGDGLPMMARTDNAVVHDAQAFGFDIDPTEDLADVTAATGAVERASRHEFGDTKYRRIVYHSVATTRFREYLQAAIAADLEKIQRTENWTDASEAWLQPLVREVPNSARPATPDVVQTLPTFRWERSDQGPKRTHVRRGKAIRVWLRRPWFSSGDGEQLGVVLEPAVRLSPGWVTPLDVMDEAVTGFARAARTPKKVAPSRTRLPASRATRAGAPGSFVAGSSSELTAGPLIAAGGLTPKKKSKLKLPGTLTPEAIHAMLQPYVTHWGSDPVWASRLPQLPPVISDFTARISDQKGLTLDEISPQAKVSVAGHEVYFDTDRMLWYSDIEIDNGDSYYPFVRLALARYQPHSLAGAHLSRIVVADFMQLAPDRTAVLDVGQGAATLTVRGYSGENITGRMWSPIFSDILFEPDATPAPNTTMRAILQRRPKDVPGDLGWEPAGPEITLEPDAQGFWVTWKGNIGIPMTDDGLDRRVLITEIETFPRDMVEGDPRYMFSPRDHLRERIVYADTFGL